jgi:hypothetical protein
MLVALIDDCCPEVFDDLHLRIHVSRRVDALLHWMSFRFILARGQELENGSSEAGFGGDFSTLVYFLQSLRDYVAAGTM